MFKLDLSEQFLNIVMVALAKQPLEVSFDVFVAIRNQVAQQRTAQEPTMAARQDE